MSSAQVGAVLGYIRKLAGTWKDQELPDDQLLERFAKHRDEAAFAVILKRHGPMVLGVCQSILHNLHDAEDAFQAAFLLLAKKAGSIHRREAVSGWLYRVAYHLAVRSRANAARRTVHERRAATMPSADPVLDLSLREVRAVLFEELEKLPKQYRSPLVLCGLEEKSREEAARLLGCSVNAVKGKLERGRELLRARLRRRGLPLSAGLFATVLSTSSASAQVSAPLTSSTLKAALWLAAGKEPVAGVISAKVAALVHGASKTMFYSKVKIATALLMAVSAGVTGIGLLRHQVLAANQADTKQSEGQKRRTREQQRPPVGTVKESPADSIIVNGRVLDPDGKPRAGAKLYLAYRSPKGPVSSERAKSGPDGRFRFTFSKSELDEADSDESSVQVLAAADGFGPDWAKLDKAGMTLHLVKNTPLSGWVQNEDGKPVAGATVHVREISRRPPEILTRYLDQTRKGHYEGTDAFAMVRGWSGPFPGQAARVTTGADGRFRLGDFGPDDEVVLRIEGPRIHHADIHVTTRPTDTVTWPIKQEPWPAFRIYGGTFDHVAAAARLIRGVVRDKATGKPVPGVQISSAFGLTTSKAQTDANGRYELPGCLKVDRYELEFRPAEGQLFFCADIHLEDTPGLEPLSRDIDLIAGIPCRGRLTDKETGKPIAGAEVHYNAIFPNAFIARLGNQVANPSSTAKTAADGLYTIMVLPGPGVLAFAAPRPKESYVPAKVPLKELADLFGDKEFHGTEDFLPTAAGANSMGAMGMLPYNTVVLIKPTEKDESFTRDVVLEHGVTRTGKIVGPDDQPVTDVTVVGLWERDYQGQTLPGDSFILKHLNPQGTRTVVFYHKKKNLGASLDVRGDKTDALTVRLQPCGTVTGRVVDADGQPFANQPIILQRLFVVNGRAASILSGGYVETKTDKDGRFRADGVIPGIWYDARRSDLGHGALNFKMFQVEPGQVKDIGEGKPYP